MDAQNDDGIFKQIKSVLHSGSWLGQVPWVYRICGFLQPVTGNYLGVNARHGKIRAYTLHEIQNRKDRGGNRQDILSKLFEVQKDKPSEMDITDVISMATSNINAGSDTTAISLRAVIYHLLKNGQCKAKLLDEIDSVMSAESSSAIVTVDQSKKMPYLQACMYEALRLHPAVGMSLPRTTPSGGISIGTHFIPEKVN
jgi:cytochrome P450